MFGAIYGDVIGSYYEVHCTKDYNFDFQKDSFFTDDSVLIAAVCKAILLNPAEISKWSVRTRARGSRKSLHGVHEFLGEAIPKGRCHRGRHFGRAFGQRGKERDL